MLKEDKNYVRICECMEIRGTLKRIQKSGLGDLFETCTFENYKAVEPWQIKIKSKAEKFLNDSDKNWFYIGGTSWQRENTYMHSYCCKAFKSGKRLKIYAMER